MIVLLPDKKQSWKLANAGRRMAHDARIYAMLYAIYAMSVLNDDDDDDDAVSSDDVRCAERSES